MTSLTLPKNLEQVFEIEDTNKLLANLTKELVETLNSHGECVDLVDRVFLYVRYPQTRYGQAAFCYCRNSDIPNVQEEEWKQEQPEDLEQVDPMFAAAINCKPSIFVDDVETADPETLNREFEAQEFGHRALVHGHICEGDKLWGILQPCVFGHPHHWTAEDKQIIEEVCDRLVPIVKEYVLNNHPPH